MKRWTPHDLRRTAATILDRHGYSLEQIGALLAQATLHPVGGWACRMAGNQGRQTEPIPHVG
jgi:hypothetical protein